MIVTKAKYDLINDISSNFKFKNRREFIIPGIVAAERNMELALQNTASIPFDGAGDYYRIILKMTLDTEGDADTHKDGNKTVFSNALNLTAAIS
jgi:hypothetical protein